MDWNFPNPPLANWLKNITLHSPNLTYTLKRKREKKKKKKHRHFILLSLIKEHNNFVLKTGQTTYWAQIQAQILTKNKK